MVKPAKREAKKPYVKPTLMLYGTVRELTLKVATVGKPDRTGGGHPLHNKTAF
jgi:hypothetical protein